MRRWVWIVIVLAVTLAAYWAWPFIGAMELAAAARRNDAAALMERVDLPALRRSLSRQIATAYLDLTGKGRKLTGLGRNLAGAAVTTVADPYVAELVTPENLLALLRQGRVGNVTLNGKPVAVSGDLPHLPDMNVSDILSHVAGSYFDGIASFVIPVESAAPDAEFRIHLRLAGTTWRLSGLDLPPSLVEEMARGVMASGATVQ